MLMKTVFLEVPNWDYRIIMQYCDVGKTKAYEIMDVCRKKFNGAIRFVPSCVKRDAVLSYLGTSIERELYIASQIEREKYEKRLHERELQER